MLPLPWRRGRLHARQQKRLPAAPTLLSVPPERHHSPCTFWLMPRLHEACLLRWRPLEWDPYLRVLGLAVPQVSRRRIGHLSDR